MGIQGLTTFLDINAHLLADVKLRDTKVVIDGNNLYHFLYRVYNVAAVYGGDYDVFAKSLKSFFGILRKCAVTPVVVMDGPYSPKEKKIAVAVHRARDRISKAHLTSGGQKCGVTPLLAHDVFISVLGQLGVAHLTCWGEADQEVAALAKKYCCPVLTNDSDFFIYNLPGGVILLDYVNLSMRREKPPTPGCCTHYLTVQMYRFSTFHGTFSNMEPSLVALFATLMGNDRVDASIFDSFFANIHVSTTSVKMFAGKRRERMLALLHWLEGAETLDRAMQRILDHIPKKNKDHIRAEMLASVSSYRDIDVCHISEFLDTDSDSDITTDNPQLPGHCLPFTFHSKLRRNKFSPLAANIAVCQIVFLLAQPENQALPSSHNCALGLRKAIYKVMLQCSWGLCSHCVANKDAKHTYIEEVDRDVKNQKKSRIRIEISNLSDVPSMCQVSHTPVTDREVFLCTVMDIRPDFLKHCPRELQLYLMTVVYWINQARPRINCHHLSAVLLCLLKLTAIDQLSQLPDSLNKSVPTPDSTNKVAHNSDSADDMNEVTPNSDIPNKEIHNSESTKEMTPNSDIPNKEIHNSESTEEMTPNSDVPNKETQNSNSTDNSSTGTSSQNTTDTSKSLLTSCNHGNLVTEEAGNDDNNKSAHLCDSGENSCDPTETTAIKSQLGSDTNLTDILKSSLKSDSLLILRENLDKFNKSSLIYDSSITHSFSQLQAVMLATQTLNQVLDFPLPPIPVELVFNGTFLFNMYRELKVRKQPAAYQKELLFRSSELTCVLEELTNLILAECEPGVLLTNIAPGGKRAKKKKSAKSTSKPGETDHADRSDVEQESAEGANDQEDFKLVAKCKLSNKFSGLLLGLEE